jgi:mannose-6-phosphate isomerase-like protein (cupin superfamily)
MVEKGSGKSSKKEKDEAAKTDTSKYGKYILADTVKNSSPVRPMTEVPYMFVGENQSPLLKGVPCNVAINCVAQPYMMGDPPHRHAFDEFWYFLAGDAKNMQDFGAEVEVALGEEWEKHTIKTTSAVYIPAGLMHAPIHVKRVDKPFYFMVILLAPTYSSSKD